MKQCEFLQKITREIIDDQAITIHLADNSVEHFYKIFDEYCHSEIEKTDKTFPYVKGYKRFMEMKKRCTEKDIEIIKVEMSKRGQTVDVPVEELFLEYSIIL